MSDSLVIPWTVAHQALLYIGFPRQEYWSGLPFPPVDPPNPEIEPASPVLAGGFFITEPSAVGSRGSVWREQSKKIATKPNHSH